MHTPVDAELPNIDMATPVGKGLVFFSHAATPKRPGPIALEFWGFMHTPFVAEAPYLITHVGKERESWGQVRGRLPSQ